LPNIIEIPSDSLFVDTVSKALYILSDSSSHQRTILFQSKRFENTSELALDILRQERISHWDEAAGSYPWRIRPGFI